MKPVWKISGKFYGWISERDPFYNSKGKRQGTFLNNILYDSKGKYLGELINNCFIGFNKDRTLLVGPECYVDEEVYLEPLLSKDAYEAIGYINPL